MKESKPTDQKSLKLQHQMTSAMIRTKRMMKMIEPMIRYVPLSFLSNILFNSIEPNTTINDMIMRTIRITFELYKE